MGETIKDKAFLRELYKRTSSVRLGQHTENQCVCINLANCSREFLTQSQRFLEGHADRFRVLVRGIDIYLEVKHGDSFLTAYEKAVQDEQTRSSRN